MRAGVDFTQKDYGDHEHDEDMTESMDEEDDEMQSHDDENQSEDGKGEPTIPLCRCARDGL